MISQNHDIEYLYNNNDPTPGCFLILMLILFAALMLSQAW